MAIEGFGFPAAISAPARMRSGPAESILRSVQRSYAIIWRRGDGPLYAGRFEFTEDSIRIQGSAPGREARVYEIPLSEIQGAAIVRDDRLRGLATMVLGVDKSARFAIATLDGPGRLAELVSAVTVSTSKEAA